jgi:hypothetical protein
VDVLDGFYFLTDFGKELLEIHKDSFSLATLRDLEGYESIQRKKDTDRTHWVKGHFRSDGTYVPGYASNFFARGLRKKKN